jgi:hypothetical protein
MDHATGSVGGHMLPRVWRIGDSEFDGGLWLSKYE